MVGYSEVIQVMVAMILFSLILMTSNKIILLNSQQRVESAAETKAISIAQSFIDEARALPFDANTTSGPPSEVPAGFSATGPGAGENTRAEFNDFDDYHGYTEDIDWIPGSGDQAFQVEVRVLYVDQPDYAMSNGSTNSFTVYKKMTVTVTSDYLKDGAGNKIDITIPYLRRYYKQQ